MCMSVLPMCKYVYYLHAWYPQKLQERIGSPRAGITVVKTLAALPEALNSVPRPHIVWLTHRNM